MNEHESHHYQPSEDAPLALSSKNVVVPLWMTVSAIGLFCSVTIWLMATLHEIRSSVKAASADPWKRSHARQFAHEMGRDNPSLKIPDVDTISAKLAQP